MCLFELWFCQGMCPEEVLLDHMVALLDSGILLKNFHSTGGKRDSWKAQTKICVYQDPRNGVVTPQETEQDLPVSV